uniref:UDP-glycosyltransferases domain-containing protein n=1 Tax=Brassica campestris TaxID=3711 RepID=M4DP93_BRACM
MPWPGRGHINPMMNLCKRLVLRDLNLIVTFVVTEEWLGFIGSDPKPDRIRFSTLPNLIHSELVRANNFNGFVDAVHTLLEEPFERLLDGLNSPPPTVIISDTYVVWAVRVGEQRNIPVVSFWTMSATILSLFLHSDLLISHDHALFEPSELSVENKRSKPDYIRWLDGQAKSSVLYISQGSFLSVSEAQMEEIVAGVRESGVPFLWVARGGESKMKEALEGSSGFVVSWCDQLRVLCHAALGGFWTHCGFNSTLEGMYSGVPMLAFPLHWDQILNGKMIVEEWRVGMKIERRKKTELLIDREEIKEVVKRLMDRESEEGKEMRRRACDVSEICRGAVAEKGSSDANIDAFIRDINNRGFCQN